MDASAVTLLCLFAFAAAGAGVWITRAGDPGTSAQPVLPAAVQLPAGGNAVSPVHRGPTSIDRRSTDLPTPPGPAPRLVPSLVPVRSTKPPAPASPPVGAAHTPASPFCTYSAKVYDETGGYFGGRLTVTNTSSETWSNWTADFSLQPAPDDIRSRGGDILLQGAGAVLIPGRNGVVLPTDATVSVRFEGIASTDLPQLSGFTVNGNTCRAT